MVDYSSRFAARLSLVQDVRLARTHNEMAAILADRSATLSDALEAERLRREAFGSTLAHELRQPPSTLLAAVEASRLPPDHAEAARHRDHEANWPDEPHGGRRHRCRALAARRSRCASSSSMFARSSGTPPTTPAVVERRHQLVVATAPEPLWAEADPQRLHQVLSNLLRNAVKYTDPGGRISLTADRSATTVDVRVSDTGCGIEAEALGHIFDLYSQVRPTDSHGLGIGLSVVREIVALHEGHVEARSEGPGRGSQFIVSLPAAASYAPPPPQAS